MPSNNKSSTNDSNSLLVIILDVSPLAWGERDLDREKSDKSRSADGKSSIGPAVLQEVLESVVAFSVAVNSIERNCGVVILAVADNESAIVYPRKDQLDLWLGNEGGASFSQDARQMQTDVITGVDELVQRAAVKAPLNHDPSNQQAAMAAAFSKALCFLNRCLVAAKTGLGVSALQTSGTSSALADRTDDSGILALSGNKKSKKKASSSSVWAPRILLMQASEDRSRDYNAFMNCAFAAVKHGITVDGCFLANRQASSSFLEQACDLTGGVFLAPSGVAQVGGTLTEVMFAVFLPPLSCRKDLKLTALHKVDFRARCFETGETVDMAFVCNQCLSIFKNLPSTECPTCQAKIVK